MEHSSLAPAVTSYFDRMEGSDKTRVLDLFTPDAVVADDGHTYRGHDDLLAWLTGPASEFTTTSTRLSADGDTATVIIRLEGNFPGGRADLRHTFTVQPEGRLTSLTITA